ncbi:unnamed protein product [Lactuca virosa]|uniref:Transposase, Ptta/En/Spm, plant n=1 Tax=Lactuca virosa TaxID=75947 RepID=A0AAU9P0B0_9ASTR|nr:unnamed protein product [Lactuca virosa]
MRDLRKLSANMAHVGTTCVLPIQKGYSKYFPEMYQHNPDMVPESVWPRLCDKWKRLLKATQKNRNTPDSNRRTSRHIVGSIGYAEHRRNLRAQLGKEPKFCDLYVKTHDTSESKKRYFEGERENIEYCLEKAKDAKNAYLEGLVMKYGEDPANHKDDAKVDRLREEVSNMRQLQEQMARMARMINVTPNQACDPPHTPPEDGA